MEDKKAKFGKQWAELWDTMDKFAKDESKTELTLPHMPSGARQKVCGILSSHAGP